MTTTNVHDMTDEALMAEMDLLRENMIECGTRSSYTLRNTPRLRDLRTEARRRGLVLS